MRCKPRFSSSLVFSVSSRYKNRKIECCDPKIRMAADSEMKNIQALIPNVGSGGGRQCGRDHTTTCFSGRTCVWEIWNRLRTERERERGTKNVYINNMATVTKWQPPLLKVTKSHYILTHLGQLPFMLFTQMARTWAIQEDSVNTSIIHWYSTHFWH